MWLLNSRARHLRAHPRSLVASGVLGAACIIAPLAVAAFWLRNQVFDTHAYVSTVAPLSSNPAIDAAVAGELGAVLFAHVDLTAEARRVLPKSGRFLAEPLAAGVRDYTLTSVERVLASPEFRSVWARANREAHDALVAVLDGRRSIYLGSDGSVGIDLRQAAELVRRHLGAEGLDLYKQVPPALLDRRLVLVRADSLRRVRLVARALSDLAITLPLLGATLLGIGYRLARERRRAVVRAGIGVALAGALALAAVALGRVFYLDRVAGLGFPRDAAAAVYDTVASTLGSELRLLVFAGLVLSGAAMLAGPSPLACHLRAFALLFAGRLVDDAAGEAISFPWVAENKGHLRTTALVACGLVVADSSRASLGFFLETGVVLLLVLGGIEVLSRPVPLRGERAG